MVHRFDLMDDTATFSPVRQSHNTGLRFGLILLAGTLAMAGTPATAAGNAVEGAKKAQFCAGCHGLEGNFTHTGTPRLAGKSEAEFVAKLQAYRSGKAFYHPLMAILVNGLNDQDIADLGAFYAAQKVEPSLKPYRPPQ